MKNANTSTIKPTMGARNTARTQQRRTRNAHVPQAAELVLVRGLPGSGKSTLAAQMTREGYAHYEADMFFMRDGTYRYDASQVRAAHEWCKTMTRRALARGQRVVVANTFTRLFEMEPYFEMCPRIRIIETQGRWPNVHGVPSERIQEMAERWEPLPSEHRIDV